MSWRERMQPGSFRGVPFHIDEADRAGGRRLAKHEYPGRDEPYNEDMGRKAGEFGIECYVLGRDYDAARDALIEALEAAGPGTLVHPYCGRLRVCVDSYRVRESTQRGGMASFSIQFSEAGKAEQPTEVVDTAAGTESAAEALKETAVDAFTRTYSTFGLPAWAIGGLEETLGSLGEMLRAKTSALIGKISSPNSLAQSILDAGAALVTEVGYSISAFERASKVGVDLPPIPFTTTLRKRQARSQAALVQLARQATLAAAATQTAQENYPSRQDAEAALQAATAAIDALQEDLGPDGSPVPDEVYHALSAIRSALVADLQARGLRLPELTEYTPTTTLPALVLAHQLYGDSDRDEELVERNGIAFPGFVPGGSRLEVLSDG